MSTTLGRSVVATTTRRGDAARARAKKKRSGGGRSGNDDYAQDFARYGSFDESYTEGAGMLLGKGELRSSGTRRGAKGRSGAGYDAVAGVLDALAEVKSERKSRGGGGRRYDAYGDDDEDAADEGAAADGTAAGEGEDFDAESAPKAKARPVRSAPAMAARPVPTQPQAPRPKPKVVVKPKKPAPAATMDPAQTKAKASQTLSKWGFSASDVETAIEATSASAGDGATAKKRQIAALDWMLANLPIDDVPDEYKLEAQQAQSA